MWFRCSQNQNKEIFDENKIDDKIAVSTAEEIVKRRLFYKGNYNPHPSLVKGIVTKVLEEINAQYGSIELARSKSRNQYFTPIIEKIINSMNIKTR